MDLCLYGSYRVRPSIWPPIPWISLILERVARIAPIYRPWTWVNYLSWSSWLEPFISQMPKCHSWLEASDTIFNHLKLTRSVIRHSKAHTWCRRYCCYFVVSVVLVISAHLKCGAVTAVSEDLCLSLWNVKIYPFTSTSLLEKSVCEGFSSHCSAGVG